VSESDHKRVEMIAADLSATWRACVDAMSMQRVGLGLVVHAIDHALPRIIARRDVLAKRVGLPSHVATRGEIAIEDVIEVLEWCEANPGKASKGIQKIAERLAERRSEVPQD